MDTSVKIRNQSFSAKLGRLIFPLFALDLPIYREVFSRVISLFASFAGYSSLNVEMYLRGLTYKKISRGGKILIGRYVILNEGEGEIAIGEDSLVNNFCYLSANMAEGKISIGHDTHFDVFCSLHGQGGIAIGNHCAIASNVTIYSQSNQYASNEKEVIDQDIHFAKVNIADHVWIGAGVVILPGVNIGQGAIIGAGAVVKSDIPEYSVAVGVPARIVKKDWKVESKQ